MNLKWKIFVSVFAVIFLCGIVTTYKSHDLLNEQNSQNIQAQYYQQSQWAAELLLQKVENLENAVAVLDLSLIHI